MSTDALTEIVTTNVLGVMLCCKEVGDRSNDIRFSVMQGIKLVSVEQKHTLYTFPLTLLLPPHILTRFSAAVAPRQSE